MSLESIIVTITPDRLREIQRLPVIPAHAVYRMGRGPHLFRANGSSAPRGGMMLLDCRTFDGLGAAPPFCQEVIQECSARGFTGGSLRQRLQEAQERFGRDRVALALQRVAEDFFLPSPSGSGTPLSQDELHRRIHQLSPSIFFSQELCARYFTYMSRESGAHFVLFDDGATLRRKLEAAQSLDIRTVLAPWPEIADVTVALGLYPAERTRTGQVLR